MPRHRAATELLATLEADAVERALAVAENLDDQEFYDKVEMRNPSRSYFVRSANRRYSLKAIIAHAMRETHGTTLARDFHAVDAAQRLRELGFAVEHEPE